MYHKNVNKQTNNQICMEITKRFITKTLNWTLYMKNMFINAVIYVQFYCYFSSAPLFLFFSLYIPLQWVAILFFWEKIRKEKRRAWSLYIIFPHCGFCVINLISLFVHNLTFFRQKSILNICFVATDWTSLIQKHFNIAV